MTPFKPGDIVNVTIKGVRVDDQNADGSFTILDEHNHCHTMPAQAAIEHAPGAGKNPAEQDDRITKALAYLDSLEYEGIIQPYVAATVRKTVGEPPRNWPPQPGDVWDDGFPSGFFSPLWFAQAIKRDGGPAEIVMVPGERDPENPHVKTPQEFMESACDLALAYRKDGSR